MKAFTLFSKGIHLLLAVNRELRASRSEARAEKRETRATQVHEKKYFGRKIEQPLSTKEKEDVEPKVQ